MAILIRDDKVTNQVASPVKFAEYLAAGLQVLISPNIGDYSSFIKEYNCGKIVDEKIPPLKKISIEDRVKNIELATAYFKKDSPLNYNAYNQLQNFLSL
jgi:hypothetical protein